MTRSLSFTCLLFLLFFGTISANAFQQQIQDTLQYLQPPALSEIKETALKADLFHLASDQMRGRRAGTLDELKAAAWVARRARQAGLQPAGEDSTYFQYFPLFRTQTAEHSSISINTKEAKLWKEAWVTSPIEAKLQAPVLWLESKKDSIQGVKGKVVAMPLLAPAQTPQKDMSLWVYRYALSAIREQSAWLKRKGARAVILVADSTAYSGINFFGHSFKEGTYAIEERPNPDSKVEPPVILVSPSWKSALQKPQAKISLDLRENTFTYPSVNVIAKASGTDLAEEYVIFSGHHDHDGVGEPVNGDSIFNGADDNASVSVALLAIGRAWIKNPGKRSALFVWHGAEERGLLGSRYFVQHPTVKKEKIVAVLNGDMIGRNTKGEAALLGSIAPHKNSTRLVNQAMLANKKLTKFKIDTSWDAASHPENWYFRSDHLPYARAQLPAIFFTTLLHEDYHTPKDEADKIDYSKLTKMTQWMYSTGWQISNSPQRPALD